MITLDRVTKQYKSSARPALDNVNVKIDKGEFVFLIGPSGSGKSTFMRLLLAAETPTKGDVRVSKFHVNTLPGRHIPSALISPTLRPCSSTSAIVQRGILRTCTFLSGVHDERTNTNSLTSEVRRECRQLLMQALRRPGRCCHH